MFKLIALSFCLFATLSAQVVEEFLFENPPFDSCHASTLTQTKSGKLLCAYFAGSEEGAKDVGIWLSVQTETGWAPPQLIAQDPDVPCWNPVLFTLPSNDILLFYKVGRHPTSWTGLIKRSSDEGKSWSSETKLPAGVIGPVKNRPLLLSDGTLLCGSSIESWRCWGCWIDLTSDEGATWTKSSPINLKNNLFGIIQPALFFASDKELRLLARSYQTGYICTASSYDNGKTWTEALATTIPNPNASVDAIRLKSGEILLVYNHSSHERFPLNVALSQNGGSNWSPLLTLEDKPGEYSYPCVIQTADGQVHITYTFNRTQIKHVTIGSETIQHGSNQKEGN